MHSSSASPSRRVLVIDDNPAIHEDFRKILGSRPESAHAVTRSEAALFGDAPPEDVHPQFHIDGAFQGAEGVALIARAQAENRPYALAFVDVRMPPGMDGIETVSRIWEHAPELPIVICTAYSDYSWQEMCDCLDRSDQFVILKKPFDNIEVLQLASALTAKSRLAREVKCRVQDMERSISDLVRELQQANERADGFVAELQACRAKGELLDRLEVIRASAKALLTIVNGISRHSVS